ncbi:LysR family transcriptional regulator [Pigmentiphaga soli]|uniref:LysR family transcriptional regulator n=1 Tax=Pigmentiphaga soli TaxID=1007095 RepID=A0ABP8GSC1_9BURK
MRITLQQIEAFFWSARLGSFHAAARHLNFTQPAISARIKELESTLQVRLFERRNQRIELTHAGRNALSHAERLLGAGQELERMRGGETLEGVLRFGADESSAMAGLTGILARLHAMHPELQIEVTIDIGTVLRQKVGRRELDVAIHSSLGELPAPHVVEQVLGWVAFDWVAAPALDVAPGPFDPARAVACPIVTNSPPSTLNSLVRNWLQAGGYDFKVHNACNSLSLMLRLAEAGHAIAILPASATRDSLQAGTLRTLPADPPIPLVAFALSYLGEDRGEEFTGVIDIVRDVLTEAGYFALPART